MGNPSSFNTENPEPRRKGGASSSKRTPTVAIDDIEAAYSDDERPSRGPWPSEAPPVGLPAGMLGEMAFYYGVCWCHYRSTQR
jgi:hypothetical protein